MSWNEANISLEVTMHNVRFRVMAGLAGATLCLFAVTSYAQNPTTTGAAGTPDASAQTPATPAPTDPATQSPTTTTDLTTTTTTTETWSFPGGMLGILAAAVLVLLVLFALFRGRDRTVIKETYTASPPTPAARTSGLTADDRLNLNSRAASGTGTNPGTGPNSGGMNDPNARR
jgi:hypothetical protein